MKQYTLGTDIGTGSVKAVALDMEGNLLLSHQVYYEAGALHEQDPEMVWKAFINCLQAITQKLQATPASLALSSYMHGIMAVDKDCMPLTPLITWADNRSAAIAKRIRSSADAETLYRKTGTPLHSMSPLTKMIWLKENQPVIFQSAAYFISVKELIWYRFFEILEIDYAVASATGMFDIEKKTWYQPALDLCGIDESRLAKPQPVNFTRTGINEKCGLSWPDVPVYLGGSDGCMANLGSYLTESAAALTIGTSAAVRITSKNPVYHFPAMTFNYILDQDNYVCGAPLSNGGNIVQEMISKFLDEETETEKGYARFFEMVQHTEAGSEGLIFLPYLHGERAPVWDEYCSGVLLGLREVHTRSHIFRAALEGVCYALLEALNLLDASKKIEELHISGGFTKEPVWTQMLADITGKKLCIMSEADASATGAALLSLPSAVRKIPQQFQATIQPQIEVHQLYQKYFKVYQQIYPSLQSSMHELASIRK